MKRDAGEFHKSFIREVYIAAMVAQPNVTANPTQQLRRWWMSVLATADRMALEAACQGLIATEQVQYLRPPEVGLFMVRGRAGGTGAKFNLGEVPVTRCAVRLPSGTVGMAWVRGRDTQHAALAARLDALLQEPQHHQRICVNIIEPLAKLQAARRELAARKVAATKVEFFTVAREAVGAGAS